MGLGDEIERALGIAGVTPQRVERWLGKACTGCRGRVERLNALGAWARRVAEGKAAGAAGYLRRLMGMDA